MNLNRWIFIPIFLLMFSFQSCFELVEKIKLNDDGSGQATFILNASKSKTKLNSIMKMKTVNGRKVPTKTEINNKISKLKKTIQKTQGISNVKTKVDYTNYIVELNCNFTSVSKLNSIVKTFQNEGLIDKSAPSNFYSYNKKSKEFKRKNNINLKEKYNQLKSADKKVLNKVTYTAVYQFNKNIQSKTNGNSKISKSKKAILLKSSLLDLINKKKTFTNTIKLK